MLDDANNLAPMPDLTALPRRRPSMEAAAEARIAGRVNAAAVSDAESGALLAERAAILKKKFESPLTKAEVRRLEYVRWTLDRIEDARAGTNLDMLEGRVVEYENFLEEIRALQDTLSNIGRNSSL